MNPATSSNRLMANHPYPSLRTLFGGWIQRTRPEATNGGSLPRFDLLCSCRNAHLHLCQRPPIDTGRAFQTACYRRPSVSVNNIPENMTGGIISGEPHVAPRPSRRQAFASSAMGGRLTLPSLFRRGGGGPGDLQKRKIFHSGILPGKLSTNRTR